MRSERASSAMNTATEVLSATTSASEEEK